MVGGGVHLANSEGGGCLQLGRALLGGHAVCLDDQEEERGERERESV